MKKTDGSTNQPWQFSQVLSDRRQLLSALVLLVIVLGAVWLMGNRLHGLFSGAKSSDLPKVDYSQMVDANSFLVKMRVTGKAKLKEHPSPQDTGIATLNGLNKIYSAKEFRQIGKPGKDSKKDADVFQWYKVKLSGLQRPINPKAGGEDFKRLDDIMSYYRKDPNIERVELNYFASIDMDPNDPYYASSGQWGQTYRDMWGLVNMNASSAWNVTTGSASLIVAGIDTGVDRNHEDLAANMWVNQGEVPDNGIDDDSNGYVDDYYGWNFVSNTNNPMDDHGHGTHTAGTIAAVGNNGKGVVGVSWNSKIMALKFLDSGGSGTYDAGIAALVYAADNGAKISNNSWGGVGTSTAMDDALAYEHNHGMVVVTAAGNSNTDAAGFSPTNSADVISVSAVNNVDAKACFSNWGLKIDVGAPGGDSTSCGGINDYVWSAKSAQNTMCTSAVLYCGVRGTSMASPHVAGLAALILSANPNLTPEEVRQIIRTTARDVGTVGRDRNFGFGRVDAFAAVSAANTPVLTPYLTSPRSRTNVGGNSIPIYGSIGGANFAGYKLEYGVGNAPSTWTTITTSTTRPVGDALLGTLNAANFPDGDYIIRLTATDTAGKTFEFQSINVKVENFSTGISAPGERVSQASISVIGTAATNNGVAFASYKLEYGAGTSPSTWTTISTGTSPVRNGALGTWNTTGLTSLASYTLRVTAFAATGGSESFSTTVTIDNELVSGWPKLSAGTVTQIPSVADLDGDGLKELIVNTGYSDLRTITAYRMDGSIMPNFPLVIPIPAGYDAMGIIDVTPVDLNGDGRDELIVSTQASIFTQGVVRSTFYAYSGSGAPYVGWANPAFNDSGRLGVFYTDMNGDGIKDLVILSVRGYSGSVILHLEVYDNLGQSIPGFARSVTQTWNADTGGGTTDITIHDLDNDGHKEFAFGYSDKVYVINDQLQVLPGWPFTPPGIGTEIRLLDANTQITSIDFDGDGQKELFMLDVLSCQQVSGGFSYVCYVGVRPKVWGLTKNGTSLSGWPKAGDTEGFQSYVNGSSVAVSHADFDGDGFDDVAIPGNPSTVYTKSGKQSYFAQSFGSGIHLSDVDGNGIIDIAGSKSDSNISIVSPTNLMWSRPIRDFYKAPLLVDMNGDGKLELIAIKLNRDPVTNSATYQNGIYIWSLNYPNHRYEWPMLGQNTLRDNNLHSAGTLPPADKTPPTVAMTAPVSGTTVAGTVTVSATASDNIAVSKVEFYQGTTLISTDLTSPYAISWNSTSVANGSVTLSAKAFDAAGNNSAAAATVTVDNTTVPTTPHITVSPSSLAFAGTSGGSTPAGKSLVIGNTGGASLSWSATASQNWCHITPLSGTVAAGGSVATSVTVDAPSNVGTFACSLTITGTGADNSPVSVPVTYSVSGVADSIAPITSITSPVNGAVFPRRGTVSIVASATDNVAVTRVEFYMNTTLLCTVTTAPYTCSWSTPNAPNKTYRLTTKAYDAAGNVGTSAVISVKTSK